MSIRACVSWSGHWGIVLRDKKLPQISERKKLGGGGQNALRQRWKLLNLHKRVLFTELEFSEQLFQERSSYILFTPMQSLRLAFYEGGFFLSNGCADFIRF